MADIDFKNNSVLSSIAGLDSNGLETNTFVEVDGKGKILAKDIIKNHGHTDVISVGATPVEAKTTQSISERVSLTIENQGTSSIKWSFVNSNAAGHLIRPNATVHLAVGVVKVYVFSTNGTNAAIVVSEGS